jgi:hypothetical protein
MTDKQRVEHILKIRWQLCVRRYYGNDLMDGNIELWKRKLIKLGIWEHGVNDLFNFYDSVFRSARERRIRREYKKYEGYERACKRYAKMVEDAPPNMDTKQWLKYLNRLDILSGRICSYESNNYPMGRFAIGSLRREFFIKTGRITRPSNHITVT